MDDVANRDVTPLPAQLQMTPLPAADKAKARDEKAKRTAVPWDGALDGPPMAANLSAYHPFSTMEVSDWIRMDVQYAIELLEVLCNSNIDLACKLIEGHQFATLPTH
eukprot:289554-Pelagomonas_calceolata.AAC.1